ncbi:hypothetical protein LTR27_008927 [Elasticomyces elasticus]|nr:hypothetical protein LTR27_008927 [Elasticomyces elasticus]
MSYKSFNPSPPPYSAVSGRHRLVIGVDFGTTYSGMLEQCHARCAITANGIFLGVSFGTTDKTSADDINVIRTWPGKDGEWKVPSRIAYANENSKVGLTQNAWGYQVEPTMTSCSWTKLLLDMGAEHNAHDDPSLQLAVDQGMLRLPPDVSPQQVCSDFLKEVHTYMTARLTKQVSKQVLDSTPVDCWLTVPAVWSDQAQSATRAAARAAGFGGRPQDTINIISEPEAGAIAALNKYMHPSSLNAPKKGEDIMICDCGGGTVDITTYTIVDTEPALDFEELCVGIGGKCGATYIDRNLHDLMRQRFGSAFDEIEMRRKGPGSRFMNAWESVKRGFGANGDSLVKEIGPLIMKGVGSSQYYDDEEGMVRLTRDDVESLFAPVVNEILRLVTEQRHAIQKESHDIDRLVLIGGFGDSDYLYSRLKSWCSLNGEIQLLCPEHPQAAIVRGAALRGMEGISPSKKRCRRSYGVSISQVFREGIDPPDKVHWNKWDGSKRCLGRMSWLIGKVSGFCVVAMYRAGIDTSKGDAITKDTKRSISLYLPATKTDDLKTTCVLYSCGFANPPEYDDGPGVEKVGQIHVDFSRADKSKMPHKRDGMLGKKMWYLRFNVDVEFGSKAGILEFKTTVNDVVSGTATISFD